MHRKEAPEIPGVSRGFPPGGVPIEVAGQLRAEVLKREIPGRRSDLFIIDSNKENFLSLPLLVPDGHSPLVEYPIWTPRYDLVTGAVSTMRWGDKLDIKEVDHQIVAGDGRIYVVSGEEKYKVIGGKGAKRLASLERIPKGWSVSLLIPQVLWGGLESAMRQQDEIMHDYGIDVGPEAQQIKTLTEIVDRMFDYFRQEEITEQTFLNLASEAEEHFRREGLTTAASGTKQKIVNVLRNVAINDRIGRRNPTVAKVKLRSAFLQIVGREVVTGLVKEKSARIFSFLMVEREMTRLSLEEAQRLLGSFGGFDGKMGHQVLSDSYFLVNPERIPQGLIDSASEILRQTVWDFLRRARTAPYLIPARLAEVAIKKTEALSLNQTVEVLKVGGMQQAIGEKSVTQLLKEKKPQEAAERLEFAYRIIGEVLSDEDNKVIRVFN